MSVDLNTTFPLSDLKKNHNDYISWISKRQNTLETSTYGSELMVSRFATELILEIRYMLWSLGVALDGPALM
jgi:hypothetical protein